MSISSVSLTYNTIRYLPPGVLTLYSYSDNPPPPQNNQNAGYAMAAGGALLAIGAVAVAPALVLVVLNVVGFSPVGPVAGMLVMSLSPVRD